MLCFWANSDFSLMSRITFVRHRDTQCRRIAGLRLRWRVPYARRSLLQLTLKRPSSPRIVALPPVDRPAYLSGFGSLGCASILFDEGSISAKSDGRAPLALNLTNPMA